MFALIHFCQNIHNRFPFVNFCFSKREMSEVFESLIKIPDTLVLMVFLDFSPHERAAKRQTRVTKNLWNQDESLKDGMFSCKKLTSQVIWRYNGIKHSEYPENNLLTLLSLLLKV